MGRGEAENATDDREGEWESKLAEFSLNRRNWLNVYHFRQLRGESHIHMNDLCYANMEGYAILFVKEIFQIYREVYSLPTYPLSTFINILPYLFLIQEIIYTNVCGATCVSHPNPFPFFLYQTYLLLWLWYFIPM